MSLRLVALRDSTINPWRALLFAFLASLLAARHIRPMTRSGPAVRKTNEWKKLMRSQQEVGIASMERKSSSITPNQAMNWV